MPPTGLVLRGRLPLLFYAVLCFFLISGAVFSQDIPRVLVRGQEIVFQDALVHNGMLYLFSGEKTLPQSAELLGGVLVADPSGKKMVVTLPGHTVTLTPSSFQLDNKPIEIPDFSRIENGQWFISAKALATALNAMVTTDSGRGIWYIDPLIRGIGFNVSDAGVEIRLQSGAPVAPTISRLSNPDRIVADFPYSVLAQNPNIGELKTNPWVDTVHIAQFQANPSIVRMVIDLSAANVRWDAKVDSEKNQLVFSVLAFNPPPIQPPVQEASKETTTLTGIDLTVKKEAGEQLTALLKLSGSASYTWRRLKPPDNRLYIDLNNCVQGIHKGFTTDSNLIDDIRISQFQKEPAPVVRLVFQLRSALHSEVYSTPEGIKILLTSQPEENPPVTEGSGVSGNIEAAETEENQKSARNGIVIALDPGHGGSDPGAHGRRIVEKEVTLDIARRLRNLLIQDGFGVAMTRDGDYDVLGYHGSARAELQARVDAAARAGARVFISLHINSSESSYPHGVATHWYKSIDLPLAHALQDALAATSGFEDRGVLRNRFYVLRHSMIPAALVEMSFLSNPSDEAKLEDPEVLERLAKALEEGLLEYTGTKRHG